MKKVLSIILCFLPVVFLFAQNEFEEFNGKNAGNWGWHLLTRGSYDSCIVESRRALNFDSTLSYVHFNLALAYLLKGEDEMAITEYKNAIKRAERFGNPKKNFEGAIDDLIKYTNSVPSKPVAENAVRLLKSAAKEYTQMTTIFLHVPRNQDSIANKDNDFGYGKRRLSALKISTGDVSKNTIWTSEKIVDFEDDSLGYFVKTEIPEIVLAQSIKTNCLYFYVTLVNKGGSKKSIESEYSFENKPSQFSKIKLNLKSTPSGADIFLIPNRLWIKEFEGKNWQIYSESYMDRFRINTAPTNTSTNIDETVYVILFRLKNMYKLRTYFTKPALIEPEQTVNITF